MEAEGEGEEGEGELKMKMKTCNVYGNTSQSFFLPNGCHLEDWGHSGNLLLKSHMKSVSPGLCKHHHTGVFM